MLSVPPATTISASPLAIRAAPIFTAARPEPHTTFSVMAGVSTGIPAFRAHCRATFCPRAAWMTQPM